MSYYFQYEHAMPDPAGGCMVNMTRLFSLAEMHAVLVALDDYLLEHDPNMKGLPNLPGVLQIKADPNCPGDKKYLIDSDIGGTILRWEGSPPPPVYVIPKKKHPLYPKESDYVNVESGFAISRRLGLKFNP